MSQTILVVDDDPDFQNVLRWQLEHAGFTVLMAETAEAARVLLEHEQPDLAVVDLMLEEPDAGFTLCYHIKRQMPSMPVILVSAVASVTGMNFAGETDVEREWIKADCMLAKPVRFEQVEREIGRLLKA